MSDDLVTWLRAQFDEDERVARGVPDHRQRRGELHWQEVDPESHPGLIGDQCGGVVTIGGPGGTGRWHAEHIARHDPARVLAEVDAKRRLLSMADDMAGGDPYQEGPAGVEVLALLALPYADRPGYRSEWSPQHVIH